MPKYIKWDNEYYIRAFTYEELTITSGVSVEMFDFTATTANSRYRNVNSTRISGNISINDWYAYKVPFAPSYSNPGSAIVISANNGTLAPYTKFSVVQNRATSPTGSWETVVNTPSMAWVSSNSTTGSAGIGITTQAMYDYFINSLQPSSGFTNVINAWKNDNTYSTRTLFSPYNYLTVILAQVTQNGDYVLAVRGNDGNWYSGLQGASYTTMFVDINGVTASSNPKAQNLDVSSPPDPYTGAGYPASTAPGGLSGGSFDFTDDPITGVHTPGLDLLNSGLITAWRPSKATLVQLANWLWVTTPGQVIQQLFGNPINAIIGLNIVPVSPPVDGGLNTIKFGNDDSGVACPKITSQHVTVDCGSITVDPIYGSYMDYAPQTSAELFLPYVGGLPLDVNDVIGKTVSVKYEIDVLSGACVAYVFIDGGLHYQKAGSCAATAPITGSQMPNVVSGVLSIAGSVAGFVASAGASGASTAAKVASGIATGTSVAESAANMLKQSISYAGTISGWAGLLGSQKPYLLLSVPHVAMPGGQNALMGYPAWVSGRVGDFTGYTECTVDRVTATRATDKEVEEIKSLLEGGVIL